MSRDMVFLLDKYIDGRYIVYRLSIYEVMT